MADKPQKTQLLTDAPPEVMAAAERQNKGGSPAPQQGQSTMMLEAPNVQQQQPPQRAAATPQMMQNRPQGSLPPMRKKSGVGRWIAGPLISIGIAAGTAALAGVVMPAKPKVVPPPPKVMGKLQLATDPPGASVTIDGKPFPHFTPTDVEAEVGSTVRIGLKLDGYQSKEEEAVIASGERPMSFKLEKAAPAAPAPVAPAPVPVAAPTRDHHEHHDHHSTPAGKGTLNVFVRPWAIVYVDGARLRQTPVQNYELSSGKHVVELVNDPKGKREKLNITLQPGGTEEIHKDWDK
jgi:serine/threonine-protein kinase